MSRRPALAAAALAVLALAAAGCGSSASSGSSTAVNPNVAEKSPAGDIPDNQAYVRYQPPGGGWSVKVPEGWARVASGATVTFTDKLNAVAMDSAPATAAPTVQQVKASELPKLAKSVKGFSGAKVTTVTRPGGKALKISFLADSKADPVTGKVTRDAVERYVFFHNGTLHVLTLSGPKGADNVDPWKIVTSSVRWA
jgi:hypothetical protein